MSNTGWQDKVVETTPKKRSVQDAEELLTVIDALTQELKDAEYACWDRRDTMIPWEESREFKRCQALDQQYNELLEKYA